MPEDAVDRIRRLWAQRDPVLDTSPLEVVGRLLIAAGRCERELVAALEPFGLTFPDFDVINTLRRIGDPVGTRAGELAAASLVTSGAMSYRLDRLVGVGLVTRVDDAGDKRAIRVRLTPRGERVAREALIAIIEADKRFLEPLTPKQRDTAASVLKVLVLHGEKA